MANGQEPDAVEPKLSDLLKGRKMTHGDFTDHARIAQNLKDVMRIEASWNSLRATQKEALEMIQHKIARILAGDPDFEDHYADIEGYARITRERLPKPGTETIETKQNFAPPGKKPTEPESSMVGGGSK